MEDLLTFDIGDKSDEKPDDKDKEKQAIYIEEEKKFETPKKKMADIST